MHACASVKVLDTECMIEVVVKFQPEIWIVAAGAELVTKGNSIHLLRSLINVNEVSSH